jgi:uncharacterized membrane protein YkgB
MQNHPRENSFKKRSFRKIEPEQSLITYEEWNDEINCKNQIFTVSTFIGMIQICVLIAMIYQDGFVSRAENPMIGSNLNSLSNDRSG